MTPSGSAIWLAIAVLVAAGFFGRSLRRLQISRAQAVILALGIGLGSFFNLAELNVGGGIIASVWGLWLMTGGSTGDALHAVEACAVGGAILFTLSPGPWTLSFAAASPLIAGVISAVAIHLLARGARQALAATLLASPVAGFAALTLLRAGAIPGVVAVGGSAFYDAQALAAVLTGVLAALSMSTGLRERPHRTTTARPSSQSVPEGAPAMPFGSDTLPATAADATSGSSEAGGGAEG